MVVVVAVVVLVVEVVIEIVVEADILLELVIVVLILEDVDMYPVKHSVSTKGLFTAKPFCVPNSHPCQEL